jgi:hypothetical protein
MTDCIKLYFVLFIKGGSDNQIVEHETDGVLTRMGEMENEYCFLSENLRERGNFVDLDVNLQ